MKNKIDAIDAVKSAAEVGLRWLKFIGHASSLPEEQSIEAVQNGLERVIKIADNLKQMYLIQQGDADTLQGE